MQRNMHTNAGPEFPKEVLPRCSVDNFADRKVLPLRVFPMQKSRSYEDFIRDFDLRRQKVHYYT